MFFVKWGFGASLRVYLFSVDQLRVNRYGDAIGSVKSTVGLCRYAGIVSSMHLYSDSFNEHFDEFRFGDGGELRFFRYEHEWRIFGNVSREGCYFGSEWGRILSHQSGLQ